MLNSTQRSTAVWIVLFVYFVVAGGTPSGEINGWVRALNALIATLVIVAWVRSVPRDNDSTDRSMLWALLAFLVACALSAFPRQSFDAALQVTALVALFYFARRKFAAEGRAAIESAAAWLCVGIAGTIAVAWSLGWADWLIVSGGAFPPLNLPLATGPFGHRHDVALIVVLLAPALWSPSFRARRPVSILGSATVGLIVLVDGSRNVELAVLAASVATVAGSRLKVSPRGFRIAAGVASGLAVVITVFALTSPVVLSRLANLATLFSRFSLWTEAVDVWLKNPLAGIGPGAFPFSYMTSGHFQVSQFDPRHPDNAVVQLLVEAGIVGVAAAVLCVLAVIRGARSRRRGPTRAVWGLLVFAGATLGANPTDFVFLVVPALVWAAILLPPSSAVEAAVQTVSSPAPRPAMRFGLTFGSTILAVAVLVQGLASVGYEVGRDSYLRGDVAAAESALALSAALDPSLAIYRRELASLAFARGDLAEAEAAYREALAMTQLDPIAWRGLALVLLAASDHTGASSAADRAVDLMFLSQANQLVRAATADAEADRVAYDIAIRTALQRAPQLLSIGWAETILASADQVAITSRVAEVGVSPSRSATAFGRVLLAIGFGRADVASAAANDVEAAIRLSAASLAALAACDIDQADRLIHEAADTEAETANFWIAAAIVSAASGEEHDRIARLALRFLRLTSGRGLEVVTALADSPSDGWRYRRIALGIKAPGASLPSSQAALWDLLIDPAKAFGEVGSGWAQCAGSTARN